MKAQPSFIPENQTDKGTIRNVIDFIPEQQLNILKYSQPGRYKQLLSENGLQGIINSMPIRDFDKITPDDNSMLYLHYASDSLDVYISELGITVGNQMAYAYGRVRNEPYRWGTFSISATFNDGLMLDLDFTPIAFNEFLAQTTGH